MQARSVVSSICALIAVSGLALAEAPTQPGDLAIGLSLGGTTTTTAQYRTPGGLISRWQRATFVQGMAFDSTNNIRHNYQGNLIGVNFQVGGSLANGGVSLYNLSTTLSTTPAGNGEIFRSQGTAPSGSVAGTTFGLTPTRSSRVSISPTNTMMAFMGYDTGRLYVLAYDAGATPGTGVGASIVGGSQTSQIALGLVGTSGISSGVEWLDDDTVVTYVVNPNSPQYEIYTIDVTRTGTAISIGTPTFQTIVPAPGVPANSRELALAYNPQISPWIAVLTSGFQSGVSTTVLGFLDSQRLADGVIGTVDMSASSQTGRNIVFGPDRNLYWSSFAGSGSTDVVERLALDTNNDGVIARTEILSIAANSSITAVTKTNISLTSNVSFPGVDVGIAAPSNFIACCTGESCAVVTVGTCAGVALANGSTCTPVNPCIAPLGSCCLALDCTQTTQDSCNGSNGIWTINTPCSPLPCKSELPVLGGDIAFGLSSGDSNLTTHHVRPSGSNGSLVGNWTRNPFIQDFCFDNASGTLHNASGNLFALDFGTVSSGARIYNFSTNGTNNAQFVYALSNVPAQNPFSINGTASTRATGLSVSPNNDMVALYATDATRVVVFAYNPGATIGTGNGAAFVGAAEEASIAFSTASAGTTWLNANTLVIHAYNTDSMRTEVQTYDVTRIGDNISIGSPIFRVAPTTTDVPNVSRFQSIAFNPNVSPFIYALASGFDNVSSTTGNRLSVIDPATWTEVQSINLSTSLQTGRDIAVGADRFLYMGQFASSNTALSYIDRLNLDTNADNTVSALDTLTDNSTTDWYTRTTTDTRVSFSGLDVAFQPVVVATGACCDGVECLVTTQANCNFAYQGDSTTCNPNPCAPVTGACCLANGTCSETTEAACFGGDFQGLGTVCNPNPCQQPSVGRCCVGSRCTTAASLTACNALDTGAAGAVFFSGVSNCNIAGNSSAPCCFADYNKASGISVQDIFDFLADWFAGNVNANVAGDGVATPTVQDIFDFLAAWFAGGC